MAKYLVSIDEGAAAGSKFPTSVQTELAALTAAEITTAVNALVAGAPGALDTLKELADALGDDASFAATVTTALATKMRGSVYDSTGTIQPTKAVHVVLDANGDVDDIVIV